MVAKLLKGGVRGSESPPFRPMVGIVAPTLRESQTAGRVKNKDLPGHVAHGGLNKGRFGTAVKMMKPPQNHFPSFA